MRKVFNEILSSNIELPDQCKSIVSFSPAITESLFVMGLGEYVKGVSVYCVRPIEARTKVVLGSYNSYKKEKLDEINPDIIFTTTGYQLELIEKLGKSYPLFPVSLPVTISELISSCVKCGIAAGYYQSARSLQSFLLKHLNVFLNSVYSGKKVYVEIDLGGPVSFGAYSYITDALKLLGVKSIFEDKPVEWLTPVDAEVSQLNPEIIIYEPKMFSRRRDYNEIKNKLLKRFGNIDALVNDKLFVTPGSYDFIAHHGPSFITEVIPWMKKIIHN